MLAVGQILRRVVRTLGDSDELQERHRLAAIGRLLGDGRAGLQEMRPQTAFELQVEPDHDVVNDREIDEQSDALKGARDAVLGHAVRPLRRQLPLAEHNLAGARPKDAGYDIDESALAGAVWADQAVHGPALDRDIDAAQRANAAEALGQSAHHQDRAILRRVAREIEYASIRRDDGGRATQATQCRHLLQAADDASRQEHDRHQDDAAINIKVIVVQAGEDRRDQVENDAADQWPEQRAASPHQRRCQERDREREDERVAVDEAVLMGEEDATQPRVDRANHEG